MPSFLYTTLIVLLWIAGGVALLLLLGIAYQAIGAALDARRFPAPGRMVDAGGHRIHLREMGEGWPAVIFDAPLGGSGISWSLVQPAVARFTATYAYDRAGLGWSDLGRTPLDAARFVADLHALIERAEVPRPVVLVGHSFGGLVARLYAAAHPEDVAGIVFVDPAQPAEFHPLLPEQRRRIEIGARLARRGAWAARLGIARLVALLVTLGARGTARDTVAAVSGGILRGHSDQIIAPLHRIPPELRPALRAMWTQPRFFESLAAHIACVPAAAQRAAAQPPRFDDKPVVVISPERITEFKLQENRALAQMSSRGQHVVAMGSGHWVQLDAPEVVAGAVQAVVDAVRSAVPLASRSVQ